MASDFLNDLVKQADDDEKLKEIPPVTFRNTSSAVVNDDWAIPFGAHKGQALKNVPASYLLWWSRQKPDHNVELLKWIVENKKHLEDEERHLGKQYPNGGKYGRSSRYGFEKTREENENPYGEYPDDF